jgi:hypothetical protein
MNGLEQSGCVLALCILGILVVIGLLSRSMMFRTAKSKRSGATLEISEQIGCDVNDLLTSGFTYQEIDQVIAGRITVEQLLQRGPAKKSGSP